MEKKKSKGPEHRILIFNATKRLVAIVQSAWAAAKMFKTTQSHILDACTGVQMSTAGFYFRFLEEEVIVDFNDLGALNVIEYDELCGVERPVYRTGKMSRKGMKYKTKKAKQDED